MSSNLYPVFSNKRFIFCTAAGALFAVYIFMKFAGAIFSYQPPEPKAAAITERGPILDRNGKGLAIQTTRYDVGIRKADIKNDEALVVLADTLAPLIEMDSATIQERIKSRTSRFLYIKKDVSNEVAESILDDLKRNRVQGVCIDPVISRTYPEHRMASHVVGFMGVEGIGLTGVEKYCNDILSPVLPDDNSDVYGNQLYLSIDTNLQFALENVAQETMTDTGAEAMMLIAAEAKTGEILAYISTPSPDLAEYPKASDNEKFDRPALYSYEPGSVFKIFSIAAVMDCGGITADSAFVCDGEYTFTSPGGEHVKIGCLEHHGSVRAREVLQYSCNDGTAQISEHIDNDVFEDKLRRMGFGKRTGIELPGETAGFLAHNSSWSLRSKPTIAMGQEIAVSALQMVSAATILANKGNKIKLTLISKVVDHEGNLLYSHTPVVQDKVISAATADHILSCMKTTAEHGTGLRANVGDVSMAVKTGTAQIYDKATRRYSTTDFISSCMALFPAEEPEIILYAVIIKAKGETYGGRIAAPVIKKMANTVIDYLAMERSNAPSIIHGGLITLPKRIIPDIGEAMPNLKGLSKRTVSSLLNREDINIIIDGDGYVDSQYPLPGTPVEKGMTIELHLK